jgi:hypothetical protein
MGGLLRYTKKTETYVRLSCTKKSIQDRPFHIKDGKIEDLDKTATNIILSTLFQEPSVMEYDLLYFKEIDKVPPAYLDKKIIIIWMSKDISEFDRYFLSNTHPYSEKHNE